MSSCRILKAKRCARWKLGFELVTERLNVESALSEPQKGVPHHAVSLQVFVDFFAEWCPPCRMVAPVLEELSAKFTEVIFLKVDVDQCQVRNQPSIDARSSMKSGSDQAE